MSRLSLFDQASRTPDALALLADDARFTYAELALESRRVAAWLAAAGLLTRAAQPLAVVLRPNRRGLCVLHACVAYGVPLLVMDPRLPAAERDALAERAQARATLIAEELELANVVTANAPAPSALDEASPLAIVPTSGSTGRTKLVVLSRAAFAASAAASALNLPLEPADRWLLCLPLSHVGGLSIAIRCLLAGAAVVPFDPRPAGLLASARELGASMARQSVTLISVVPTVLEALLADPDWSPPPSLRALLVGGAGMDVQLLRRAEARRIPVLTTYGLTEACSQVATTPFGTSPRVAGSTVSSGRPLPGIELAFDAEQRLKIRAASRCSGYLGEPLPLDAEGFLLTQDRGYVDDATGELFVLGRHDDLIVSGGENVDPRRVEAILAGAPGVRAASVFGAADPRFGEVVVCALVTDPDFAPDVAAAYLRQHLAPHERPRRLARVAAFPLLLSGKIDRQALRALALESLAPWPASGGAR